MLLLPRLLCLLPLAAAQNFCDVHGKFVKEFPDAINRKNKEASGLTLNADGTYFLTVSDSPNNDPLIFATSNAASPLDAATIRITGVANNHFNGGYGDWESVADFRCATKPSRRCIIVGDIGHNKVRDNGGTLRNSTQSVRLIEVEEPNATELSSGQVLEKPGKEYTFSYPGGKVFDAEAMVAKDDRLFIVTKNSAAYPYSHMFEVPKLFNGVELVERAIFQVNESEVTAAASSPGYLILRTYIGLNFYKWDSLCDESVRKSQVYQSIDSLKNDGLQEAIEYDGSTANLYLVGEGSSTLNQMQCLPAGSPTLSPTFGDQCLDNYGGEAVPPQPGVAASTKFLADVSPTFGLNVGHDGSLALVNQ